MRHAPYLTRQDFRVLAVVFGDAHRQGRMTDDEWGRTVATLHLASQRLDPEQRLGLGPWGAMR